MGQKYAISLLKDKMDTRRQRIGEKDKTLDVGFYGRLRKKWG